MSKKSWSRLHVDFLETGLRDLSIAQPKPKLSQFQILDRLCQADVRKKSVIPFDLTSLLDNYINKETGELVFPNQKVLDNSAILQNSDIVIDFAMKMVKTLISMVECLIDGSNRIPDTLLLVIYENQIHVVETMLNSGWGEKLPDIWKVFLDLLLKKKEVLDTFVKANYINHANPRMFLDYLNSWSQFQRRIFRTCVSISVGYEIVMPAIEDAWRTLFDLERYVLEKIMLEEL
jgi:hypothetical protein